MSVAGEAATNQRFRPVAFVVLCLTAGPPIGFMAVEGLTWLQSLVDAKSAMSILRNGDYWFFKEGLWLFGYVGSWIFALPAAVLFVMFVYKLSYSGIGAAVMAGSIPPTILILITYASYLFGTLDEPIGPWGILRVEGASIIAMCGCWLVARVFRIIR